jgi:hypothetical protein
MVVYVVDGNNNNNMVMVKYAGKTAQDHLQKTRIHRYTNTKLIYTKLNKIIYKTIKMCA